MAEITTTVSKDRIAADILIAMMNSGRGVNSDGGGGYFSAEQAAKAFKTIREVLDKQ